MSNETVLRAAAKVYMGCVHALSEFVPGEKITYFEDSPSKNPECFNRWLALNEAGKVLKAAIEASATPPPPAGSREAAGFTDVGTPDEMCPNCVTPNKCNGPHLQPGSRPEDAGLMKLLLDIRATHDSVWDRKHPELASRIEALAAEVRRLREYVTSLHPVKTLPADLVALALDTRYSSEALGATIRNRLAVGTLAPPAAGRADGGELATELAMLRRLVEETIMVATTDEDADGFISAYHFKTGAIHRLLAAVRTQNYPAHIRQACSDDRPAAPLSSPTTSAGEDSSRPAPPAAEPVRCPGCGHPVYPASPAPAGPGKEPDDSGPR